MIQSRGKTHTDLYNLRNPAKYISPRPPVYKSGWEGDLFYALDINPYVLTWGYEAITIIYTNPLLGKPTVYYPDIFIKVRQENGNEQSYLIEVKPAEECVMPKVPIRRSSNSREDAMKYEKAMRRYKSANREFLVNMAKWAAAQKWCLSHGVAWKLLNEKNTGSLFS